MKGVQVASKADFEWAWLAMSIILLGPTTALATLVEWRWGVNAQWVPFALSIILAWPLTNALLKHQGRSAGGWTTEVRERIVRLPEDVVGPDEVIVHSASRSELYINTATLLILVPLATGLGWPCSDRGLIDGLPFVAFDGLAGAFLLSAWWNRDRPWLRADAHGLLASCGRLGLRRRFVEWEDVRACELTTIYAPWGEVAGYRTRLLGETGEILLDNRLAGVPRAERERVVKYIRAKLPKTWVDPLEL